MTAEQIKSGIWLGREMRKRYPTIKKIFRHKDINATECPGIRFDNKIIIEVLQDMVIEIDEQLKSDLEILASYTNSDGTPLLNKEYWTINTKENSKPNPLYVAQLIKNLARKIIC
jgi:hypothetical protein